MTTPWSAGPTREVNEDIARFLAGELLKYYKSQMTSIPAVDDRDSDRITERVFSTIGMVCPLQLVLMPSLRFQDGYDYSTRLSQRLRPWLKEYAGGPNLRKTPSYNANRRSQ
ncbi:hypothetical protein B0H13DRAFT_1907353 [Mycena leptocephala]|nr:hypothetical protein B0H13DRAFT_1907353 [Mycena leptocephala]